MRIPENIYQKWTLNRIHMDWAVMAAQDYRIEDPSVWSEALSFSRQMMRRAGSELEQIIDRLVRDGYRFAATETVLVRPESNVEEWVKHYRQKGVYIPVVLEAWLMEVGSVNLIGSHPDWSRPGYIFEDGGMVDPLRTDAFVCEVNSSYVDYLYDEWESLDDIKKPPFRIDISPDYLHKANISGGPPYQIDTRRSAVDALVLNERHCTSFVGLLRLALRWNGFPGFEEITGEGEWCNIRNNVI
ncbi:MAG: hypothetical protein RKO66_01165 [Candidatus Contendobacter sp.]|nr:hypothetical protein [Candidatus Contendobacter sp.]MDS4059811.1 hypothetical protein [Candidatus Contendobacter sp.]